MPIRSMTGFGLAEAATPSGTYRVEIRAVNNRFQELQIRQPKFMLNLEPKIKKEITGAAVRGSISVFISCDKGDSGPVALTWDKEGLDGYMRIFNEIKKTYKLSGEIAISDLLRFGDFIKSESEIHDDEALWKHLRPPLTAALKSFQESRETEGAQLVKELKKTLKEISKTLHLIEKRAPQRVKEYGAALSDRIEKMLSGNLPDPQRIATEVTMMAERLDITEEIVRLKAHIEKFSADFEANEPVGKRMGFLLQEMNREANTIGSKANDTEIAHWSISLKENIEKIREQIQNIE
ncbi:MAG: YicC family protein [Chitinispirillales bacterium]|nr:YicC family protein [Chitinispirillales bacterium]